MKVVFTAWLLINGAWTHGSIEYGWWPYQMETEAQCERALEFSEDTEAVRFSCETVEDTLKYMNDLVR